MNMNLEEILKKHEMWLKGEEGGERANLKDANLSYANLRGIDLSYADLSYANLSGAYLWDANLMGADLSYANLKNAILRNAILMNADLSYADLSYADLIDADLIGADLRNTDLSGAELSGANLKNADLIGIKTNTNTMGYHLACPEEGSFIGYKKANGCIVKLLILEDSKRSSATTMKCRCDKAKVLDIENIKTGLKVMKVSSNYNSNFIYKIGEIITVDNFDDNRWNECAPGIHFFMNKENAINYY